MKRCGDVTVTMRNIDVTSLNNAAVAIALRLVVLRVATDVKRGVPVLACEETPPRPEESSRLATRRPRALPTG